MLCFMFVVFMCEIIYEAIVLRLHTLFEFDFFFFCRYLSMLLLMILFEGQFRNIMYVQPIVVALLFREQFFKRWMLH